MYTNVWTDTTPNGTEAANTIATIFRTGKVDIEQRLGDIFALPVNDSAHFAVDPLRPYGLKFTDAADSVISLGDNAGTPRSLLIKDKAGVSTYLNFSATPAANVSFAFNAGLTSTTVNAAGLISGSAGLTISAGTSSVQALTTTSIVASAGIGANSGISIAGGVFAAGNIYYDTTNGLQIGSKTGSAFDFILFSAAGQSIMLVPTGTRNIVFQNNVVVSNGLTVSSGGLSITGLSQFLVGNIALGSNASNATQVLSINTAAGFSRNIEFLTAGALRWRLFADASAESGGNVGSNFSIFSYNDAGVQIDAPLSVVRAAGGILTLSRPTNISGLATLFSGLTVSSGTTSVQALTTTTINASSLVVTLPGTQGNITIGDNVFGSWSSITLKAGSTNNGWRLGASDLVSNSFTLAASTTVGGAVFTTPLLTINTNGNLTIANGLTVSSGATSLQALTATTGTFSSVLTSTITTGSFLNAASATTGQLFSQIINTSGNLTFGVESSVGGSVFTGATAYSSVFGTAVAKSIHFATNATVRATIDSTGNLSLTQGLTVANGLTVSAGTTSLQGITGTAIALTNTTASLLIGGTLRMFADSSYTYLCGADGATKLWIGKATGDDATYINATTLFIRNDLGSTTFATFANAGITLNSPLTVTTGTTSLQALTATIVTLTNGLTVSAGGIGVVSGASNIQALTATTGIFSGLLTASAGTVIPNGQFYSATRNSGTAVINVLGFDSGTDILRLRTGGDAFSIRDTGNVDQLSMTSGGVFTFNHGISITSGTSSLQALTATGLTITGSGITAAGGISVSSGSSSFLALSASGLTITSSGITATGGISVSGGLTVSSGTSSLQALTCTGITASSDVTAPRFYTTAGSINVPNNTLTAAVTLSNPGIYLFVCNAGINQSGYIIVVKTATNIVTISSVTSGQTTLAVGGSNTINITQISGATLLYTWSVTCLSQTA